MPPEADMELKWKTNQDGQDKGKILAVANQH